MARTARLKKTGTGTARYHLMSRTNDKRFLFAKGEIKAKLVEALKRSAAFSGIALNAYTAMDNHFHIVCTVNIPEGPVPEETLLKRLEILKGKEAAEATAEYWDDLRFVGNTEELERQQNRLRRRMNDISEMVKTFKEIFDRWFKARFPYCGSIWSGRFFSTMIEDGKYFSMCKRYVVLNPVRAKMVTMAKDYAWSWSEDDAKANVSLGPVPGEAGSVPDGKLMRRVAQIGGGKIFGSREYVRRWLFEFGDRLRGGGIHPAGELGYSSHGALLEKRPSFWSALGGGEPGERMIG